MAISLPDRFLVWEPSVQYRAIQEFLRITGGRHSAQTENLSQTHSHYIPSQTATKT